MRKDGHTRVRRETDRCLEACQGLSDVPRNICQVIGEIRQPVFDTGHTASG
jgi:hypothetical protein